MFFFAAMYPEKLPVAGFVDVQKTYRISVQKGKWCE